ncbi:MAG: hypothetical protein JWL60_760 [Gemmatimonadetes bacterium]|jgi:hypothetical protein|nr:hypothetical protein [Gemmatimonadota bacterium]
MRTYDVAVASLAIDAPVKWTDNLLSHHPVPGVVLKRRGVARKIPHAALLVLAAARQLHLGLGLSVRDATALALRLLAGDGSGVHASGHLRVTLDRRALEQELDRRLRDALESAPSPRRGRPTARGATAAR